MIILNKGRPRKHKKIEIGDIVGDMKIVQDLGANNSKQIVLLVECTICLRQKEMKENTLYRRSGINHSSCGKGLKLKDEKFYTHWQNMRTRTNNSNYQHANAYKDISSDSFSCFIDFYDAFYPSYLQHVEEYGASNTTLDRIDPSKDYTFENCRWATWQVQYENVRRSIHKKAISPEGTVFFFRSTTAFAKEHNIAASTIRSYLNPKTKLSSAKGWHFELVEDSNDYRKLNSMPRGHEG